MTELERFIDANKSANRPTFYHELADGRVVLYNYNFGQYILNDDTLIKGKKSCFKLGNTCRAGIEVKKVNSLLDYFDTTTEFTDVKEIKQDNFDKASYQVKDSSGEIIRFYGKRPFNFLTRILGQDGKYKLSITGHECIYESPLGIGKIPSTIITKPVSSREADLIDAYKIFYRNIPDFEDSKTHDRLQELIYVLEKMEIGYYRNVYSFDFNNTSTYPISTNLTEDIKFLKRLGAVQNYVTDKRYYQQAASDMENPMNLRISALRDALDGDIDYKMRLISSILYFQYYKSSDAEILSRYTSYPKVEVEKGLSYIKKMIESSKRNGR